MKIGILTYHRAENYGALLQAYALRTYLQDLGHDVSFVDYWPKYHEDFFKLFSWNRFKSASIKDKFNFLLDSSLWLYPRMTRKKKLQFFIKNDLGVIGKPRYNEKTKLTERFDCVVYGSDQIWRKQKLGGVGFDDWYFGADNVVANQKVVYAGSMGTIKTTVSDDEYVQCMMRHFQNISVREVDLQNYLRTLQVQSTLVIDPVFLLSKEQWLERAESKCNNGEKYILFYNLLNKQDSARFAEKLSRETGIPIREINKRNSFKHLGKRYISTASVGEFLQLVQNAEYVVSNSFHGVAFSLIFQKQFFAVGMGEKANRVVSLLVNAGVSERYVTDSNVSPMQINTIDYQVVNKNLGEIIESSKNYLISSIVK